MTKRETGFLLIGLGIGLTLALVVINEVFKSLIGGARIDSYSFDKMLIVIPSLLLVAGATLLLWKPRRKPDSNALAADSIPQRLQRRWLMQLLTAFHHHRRPRQTAKGIYQITKPHSISIISTSITATAAPAASFLPPNRKRLADESIPTSATTDLYPRGASDLG